MKKTLKATDLRIRNIVEYCVHDELSELKTEWLENLIDFDDLCYVMRNGINDLYRGIKMTNDWHEKFEAKKEGNVKNRFIYILPKKMTSSDLSIVFIDGYVMLRQGNESFGYDNVITLWNPDITRRIIYVHEWQNLYFALTGKELIVRKGLENG
jgi:hypothetical protein